MKSQLSSVCHKSVVV